ncbi:FG-GAP and VCBS repeat-containing protein [Streptomyces sp. NPDC049906]|uniref:FG-GAP and VCBS repeat-containing protein n=1 Tax=Streptomyces sp. NPDC049906 TaxID=3155656 RepID=UPI00343AED67
MRTPLRLALATAAVTALTSSLLVSPARATPASPAAARTVLPDDFNGDGHRDYAVGHPHDGGGRVAVTYGTSRGPGSTTVHLGQHSPGVPGADEPGDEFGGVLSPADFNGDGYGDLAVSSIGEAINGRDRRGAVVILWGSPRGLAGGTSVPSAGYQAWNMFGSDLATGDFDGDGDVELAAVESSNAFVFQGTYARGAIAVRPVLVDRGHFYASNLIAGKVTKDRATDLVVLGAVPRNSRLTGHARFFRGGATELVQGRSIPLDVVEDEMGSGVVADFDKDGYGDIAIGTPLANRGKGYVTVWRGGAKGPTTHRRIDQATAGVSGTPESGDRFGASLAAGDIDRDGRADLAVGVPGEDLGAKADAGSVHVLRGHRSGLTARAAQYLDRATPGVPGPVTAGDAFGNTVRLADHDHDGRADLHTTGTTGSLRLHGSASGITSRGATVIPEGHVVGILR